MDATISPLRARVLAEVLRTINAIRAAIRTAKWAGGGTGVQIRGRPEAAWWWVERVVVRDLQNQRQCWCGLQQRSRIANTREAD